VRAGQTVSEMAVGVLARQTEEPASRTGLPFGEAFEEVKRTEAGDQPCELGEGPYRHEKARYRQASLPFERVSEQAGHPWPESAVGGPSPSGRGLCTRVRVEGLFPKFVPRGGRLGESLRALPGPLPASESLALGPLRGRGRAPSPRRPRTPRSASGPPSRHLGGPLARPPPWARAPIRHSRGKLGPSPARSARGGGSVDR
jgi:hypothetical protein